MPKPKGSTKTGGKAKGTPNKLSRISREAMAAVLEGSTEKIKAALKKLESDPYLYLNTIVKFLPYVIAKKTDITSNGETISQAADIDFSKLSFDELYELRHGHIPLKIDVSKLETNRNASHT